MSGFLINPYALGGAVSPIALIANAADDSDGTDSLTSGINTAGATLIVLASAYYGAAAAPVISDSKGNTWTPLTVYSSGGGVAGKIQLYYAENPIVGSGHTFAGVQSGSYHGIAVAAFSLVKTTSPFDVENGAGSASATTQQPGSASPSENNELLVTGLCFVASSGTPTIDSSFTVTNFTNSGSNFTVALAYKVQAGAGAENPTWSSNIAADRMAAAITSFKHV